LIEERAVEIYNRLRDELRRDFERLVDEYLGRSNVDEKTVKSIARAVASQEFARLHGIVMEEISRLKSEVEELGRQGVDAELVRKLIDEVYNKLLDDVRQIIDQRIMHLVDAMNEVSNVNKDVLDLVNEILKAEVAFEEELGRLRSEIRGMFSEERIEEALYRTLVKRGIIRQRRRRWTPLIAGLSILAAIIAGFIINPIATLVILFIAIVVLLRW
jgi:hypothetical protein